MAQVALLHTEMNSGLRFKPRMGINSAAKGTHEQSTTCLQLNAVGCCALYLPVEY